MLEKLLVLVSWRLSDADAAVELGVLAVYLEAFHLQGESNRIV